MTIFDPRQVLEDYIVNKREGKCVPLNQSKFSFRVQHTSKTSSIDTLVNFDRNLNGYQMVTRLGKLDDNTQNNRDKVARWLAENPRREIGYHLTNEGVTELRTSKSYLPKRSKKSLVSLFRDSFGRTSQFVDEDLPKLQSYLKQTK